MTRSIIKAAAWTLGADTDDDTPEGVYSVVCSSCGAEPAVTENERLPVEVWALKHTGLNPDHRRFKVKAETFWCVTPAEGNPYGEKDAQDV
ncbi:hypothetical protein [Streptomyces sp. NBC_00878]|uniref:DUF7848 domain-containing protein n=1 Tax=Streptomyces sp. NBC_00878 TaxID=2975854 RepID=UPI002258735A|nr:hypothetical protein [Streptomyces sp. NBC_00878]MCX4905449.1 hypothetical protein [Streptomyces sp. NBC_00878]